MTRAFGVAVALLMLVGCGEDGEQWEPYILAVDEADENSTRLLISGGCHRGGSRATVVETAENVEVLVEVEGAVKGDCRDQIEIELEQPLGGRIVIDASTGQPACTPSDYEGPDFGGNCRA